MTHDRPMQLGNGAWLVVDLSSATIKRWFERHGATMRPCVEPEDGAGDSEVEFVSHDGQERLRCDVTYHEGCPTCGGAYVKEWTMTVMDLFPYNIPTPRRSRA